MFTIETVDGRGFQAQKYIKEEHGISFKSIRRGIPYFIPYANISYIKEETRTKTDKHKGGILNEICKQCV